MKRSFKISVLLAAVLLIPLSGFGRLGITGDITPNIMLRVSDGSLINLPFRVGDLTLRYSVGDFDLTSNLALETRWEDAEFDADMLQVREAYLTWFPTFGEVKLGKIIHAWGAADANNPTDNLSPYDFYYMFLAGTDRKLGSLSGSIMTYFGDFQLEAVVIPQFVENRLPYNEPDFPIKIELPADAELINPEDEVEIGTRLKYAMGLGDISVSYFKAHDRLPSPMGVKVQQTMVGGALNPGIYPQLGYRETNMIGADFVFFPGNWTLRGEGGYFATKTPDMDLDASLLTQESSYLQYILQLEYSFANGVQVTGQFIHTNYGDVEQTFTPDLNFATLPDTLQLDLLSRFSGADFQAGMGTPFAMISEKVFIVSSMGTFFDNALELSGMGMVNLEETGYMLNVGAEYTLRAGLNLVARSAYFIGGDEDGNRFREMEDFSNLTLGLNVSF